MSTTLGKPVEAQLVRHLKMHPANRLHGLIDEHIEKHRKKSAQPPDIFKLSAKLSVYAGTCGSTVRTGIADLKPSGTILLVKTSSGQVLHVELNEYGKRAVVTRVSSGGSTRDLEKAIEQAVRRRTTIVKGLELRVLRVAAMHLSAVWVHHLKRTASDTFIPYTPNFAGLRRGRQYDLRQIERLLKKYATQMILRWYDRHEKGHAQSKPSPGH